MLPQFGSGRIERIEKIIEQCLIARENGVHLNGICIYPITEHPGWDNLESYSNCGLWDIDENKNRIQYGEYLNTTTHGQHKLKNKKTVLDSVFNLFW